MKRRCREHEEHHRRSKIAELGDTSRNGNMFASLVSYMLISVLCIYSVLVLLFKRLHATSNDLGHPAGISGIASSLLITGRALSCHSCDQDDYVDVIVTKNSILLVDYAIIARRQGNGTFWLWSMPVLKRSRPIVTGPWNLGMMPLALG